MSRQKKGLWRSILGFLSDSGSSQGADLRKDVKGMLKGLEAKADFASFSMARADEARDKLQEELDNYDALERQAEQFMRGGDEEAATRCAVLMIQSGKAVERLKVGYEALQKEAEQNVQQFRTAEQEVLARREELPRLQDEQRLLELQEGFKQTAERYNLETSQESFDQTAREIRIRKLQIQNRQLLEADPNAEIDARIKATLEANELNEVVRALREKVGREPVKIELVDETPKELPAVSSARKLLEAPRYEGILKIENRPGAKVER